jgi:hypothetical protein
MDEFDLVEDLADDADGVLGSLVALLEGEDREAAALALESATLTLEEDWLANRENFPDGMPWFTASLLVDPYLWKDLTHDDLSRIEETFFRIMYADRQRRWSTFDIVPSSLAKGWREARQQARLGTAENQAGRLPGTAATFRHDGWTFNDGAEVIVYKALKAKQDSLPATETIAFVPNCSIRVTYGRNRTPDFLVTYRGRAGAIEIDGLSHKGRLAADLSKDRLLEHSGISYILRMTAEATESPGEVNAEIDHLLKKLS